MHSQGLIKGLTIKQLLQKKRTKFIFNKDELNQSDNYRYRVTEKHCFLCDKTHYGRTHIVRVIEKLG